MGVKHIKTMIDDGEMASVEERVRKTDSPDVGKVKFQSVIENKNKAEITEPENK